MITRENKIILILGSILFLITNIMTLQNGHNWGDDFSQYILHAKNIAQGKPYTQGLILNAWTIYPPGLPLLLAPLVKFFGINFQILKIYNVLGWLISCFFLFLFAKKKLSENISTLVFICLLFSPYFFFFKQSILSEIPFIAFTLISLFCWEKYFNNNSRKKSYLLTAIFFMIFAFFTRFAGLALFFATILWLFFIKRQRLKAVIVFIIALACLGALSWLGNIPKADIGSISMYQDPFLDVFHYISTKAVYPVRSLILILFSIGTPQNQFLNLLLTFIDRWAFIIFILVLIQFILKIKSQQIELMDIFFIIYFFLALFWPIIDGVRYLLPIAGIVFIFIIEKFMSIFNLKKIKNFFPTEKIILVALLWLLFCNIFATIKYTQIGGDDQISTPAAKELIQKAKSIINKDAVFVSVRARAVSLLIERPGILLHYSPYDPRIFYHLAKTFNVAYFIKFKTPPLDDIVEIVHASVFNFDLLWENDSYAIFKITPK